jgi:hypothetical protein
MLATIAMKSQFLGANREINIGHHRTVPDAGCNGMLPASATFMLPLAAFPMYYPAARCSATPVGANRQ